MKPRLRELLLQLVNAMKEQTAGLYELARTNETVRKMLEDGDCLVRSLDGNNIDVKTWALDLLAGFYDADFHRDELSHEFLESLTALGWTEQVSPLDHLDRNTLVDSLAKLAKHEPNENVRSRAIRALGRIVARHDSMEKRQVIGEMCANLVLDEAEPLEIRKAAYWALFSLTSTAEELTRRQWLFEMHDDPIFPDQIEWEYVRSWKNSKRKALPHYRANQDEYDRDGQVD